jgi:hypothetical protein
MLECGPAVWDYLGLLAQLATVTSYSRNKQKTEVKLGLISPVWVLRTPYSTLCFATVVIMG